MRPEGDFSCKRAPACLLLLWEGTVCGLESGPHQTPKFVIAFRLCSPQTMSDVFLLFINYWFYSILLEPPESAFWKWSPVGERVPQFSCSFSDSQRGLEQGSHSLNWIATVELNTEPSLPARWNLVALSLIMILVLDGGPQSCDLGRVGVSGALLL